MSHFPVTHNLWNSVKTELQKIFPKDIYQNWFAPLVVCEADEGEVLSLEAPTDFAAIWVQENYLSLLRDKVRQLSGRDIEVTIRAAAEDNLPAGHADEHGLQGSRLPREATHARRLRDEADAHRFRLLNGSKTNGRLNNLNQRNIFENFIVGPSNQLAHAASLAVAKNPGKSYNPLFLHGETGLGKTHLMQAIAHCVLQNNPGANVVYVTCEKFTNEFLRAIRENDLDRFRRFYRKVDVLMIDDIQFLGGKERTQDEFFHTFNELFDAQRQLCLTSDRPASEIVRLEDRLVSRFQWGMVTDIQVPDLETRVAILAKKAANMNYRLSQEILTFLAQNITSNVRDLEGALTKVATYSSLVHSSLDLPTVERLVKDLLRQQEHKQITMDKIKRCVVEHYDIRMSDMSSKRRPSNIAFPRQVAMYFCRLLTNHPLKEIGESFGGRDHGTVIHACKTIENSLEQDESFRRTIEFLQKQITSTR